MNLNLEYSAAQHHMFFDSAALGRWRLFPKGRRLGATRGAAAALTEMMLEGYPILWGDTIVTNINRYIERYFLPIFQQNKIPYDWRKQDKSLHVGSGYIDFRSADRPENWEGFGYRLVFLNEAGIILDDPYLYYNAVLPMMLDYPDSQLIAAGTPKLTQGMGELFAELIEKAAAGEPGYYTRRYTTFDNPWLNDADIKLLEHEIPPAERPQEIEGKLVRNVGAGEYFKREWFPILEYAPELRLQARYWDMAATELSEGNRDPDWTIGLKLGARGVKHYCLTDLVRCRKNPAGVDLFFKETALSDGPDVMQWIPIDPGAAGKTALRHFQTLLPPGYAVRGYAQTSNLGNKVKRSRDASSLAGSGAIEIVRGHWNTFLFSQLEGFPNPNIHDDAVDALSAGVNNPPTVSSWEVKGAAV